VSFYLRHQIDPCEVRPVSRFALYSVEVFGVEGAHRLDVDLGQFVLRLSDRVLDEREHPGPVLSSPRAEYPAVGDLFEGLLVEV